MTKTQNLPEVVILYTITDHLAVGGRGNSLQDLVVGRTSMAVGSFKRGNE